MAAFEPFQIITGTTAGKAVVVSYCTTALLDSTGGFAPVLMVANNNSVFAFLRMTTGTTTGGSATNVDCPLQPNTVRLFANPNPVGSTAIAIMATVTADITYVCPGEGGCL